MNQISSVESSLKSSPTQPLNPTLQVVLGNLDVHLEEELTRFRRQRPGKKTLMTNGSSRPKVEKTLDLISVKATNGTTEAASNGNGTAFGVENLNEQLNIPVTASAASHPVNEAAETNYTQAAPAATFMQPDDYLESSEALLKNLTVEAKENPFTPEKPERESDGLLSPLGIGSMLLLLLASATLGYVVMNPASVSHLNRLFEPQKPKVAENQSKTAAAGNSASEVRKIPTSPNLAAQEFDELNLRSLSRVQPRVASVPSPAPRPQFPVNTPAPIPSPAGGNLPLDLSRSLLPQTLPSGTAPIPTSTPTPATPQRQASAKSAPAGENRYLVVMEYNGSRSLTQARKVAANAFVRRLPEGNRIQLASFPTAKEARTKVQQLQKQGVSAQLYRRP